MAKTSYTSLRSVAMSLSHYAPSQTTDQRCARLRACIIRAKDAGDTELLARLRIQWDTLKAEMQAEDAQRVAAALVADAQDAGDQVAELPDGDQADYKGYAIVNRAGSYRIYRGSVLVGQQWTYAAALGHVDTLAAADVRALNKAALQLATGCAPVEVQPGVFLITSATRSGTVHRVTGGRCTCEARSACWHVAAAAIVTRARGQVLTA